MDDPLLRKALAEALLLPFVKQEAPGDQGAWIQNHVLREVGDPRIHPDRWENIDESAVRVIKHWLVQTTLEDFFVLLDRCSHQSADARRQWPYRKAFYQAYLDEGYIEESWLALRERTQYTYGKQLSELGGEYGELKGGQGHQAVLILKIGGYTLADWSYSGSARIWAPSDRRAPQLYRKQYRSDALREAQDNSTFPHRGSENYRWQGQLRDAIKQKTGIPMDTREFRKRRKQ